MKTANQVYAVQGYKECETTKSMILTKIQIETDLERAQALFDTWQKTDNMLRPEFTLIWLH